MEKNRKTYLDILRILAIFLVLFNHLPGYHLFMSTHGVEQAVNLMLATITRINVPMFAMISGALLLGREESYEDLWNKRISRMLIVIPLFTTLLYLEFGLVKGRDVSFNELFRGIFSGGLKSFDSYWFLYAYLGFLLMLPFLRKVAKKMTKGDFIMIMVLHIIFLTIVPLTNFTLLMCGQEKFILSHSLCVELSTATLLFYPLIGYYIDHNIDINNVTRKHINILLLASFTGIIFTSLVTYLYGERKQYVQDYLNIFNYLTVITIFLIIKKVTTANLSSPMFTSISTLIASLAFGVYLLDNCLKLPLYDILKETCMPLAGTLGFSVLWCIFSFIVCGTFTWMLKRLPLFKKIL